MTNNQPIGLFDSGIGGTSIWHAIHQLLPNESTIYLADSKNAPYGQKSKEEIIALSRKNVELLLEKNCKLIVVACNTATTNAIKELRDSYDIPFIGIEPAIKPAALNSKTQIIGILATKGTLNSALFAKNLAKYKNIKFVEQVGFGLVQLIENGEIHSAEMSGLLESYLQPMIAANIDYLVLGCSHYPYLIPQIKKILPKSIQIIDSGAAVAIQTQHVLENEIGLNALSTTYHTFFTNGNSKVLKEVLNQQYEVVELDF
jgi:glutamate racemase